jgi:hypothetical protein
MAHHEPVQEPGYFVSGRGGGIGRGQRKKIYGVTGDPPGLDRDTGDHDGLTSGLSELHQGLAERGSRGFIGVLPPEEGGKPFSRVRPRFEGEERE